MNNYSDLTAISAQVQVQLELIGNPDYQVAIAGINTTCHYVDLNQPFNIDVELMTKDYSAEETAVIIRSIRVDGIELIDQFVHWAQYTNDHNHTAPTNYIGFVGRWSLQINQPFYQWLHQATSQGWLLTPL